MKITNHAALVVQYGARHQYAFPVSFARDGKLAALYTDACAVSGLGRLAGPLSKVFSGSKLASLAARRPPAEVALKTRAFDRWALEMELARRETDPECRVRAIERAQLRAGDAMIKAGFEGASHVVTMFGEGRRFLYAARDKGLTVISDVNVAPSAEQIVAKEQALHSDWEPPTLFYGQLLSMSDPDFKPLEAMLAASNRFLCPSSFVRDDLINNFSIPRQLTRVTPYAINPKWFSIDNKPVFGRVLFAGTAGLRKGIHVLAEAAEILHNRGKDLEFLVAGEAIPSVRDHVKANRLQFLGRLPYAEMVDLFKTADVFVLPSLAEGSAGVTYEALGAGVPVVTTAESGSPVRDGLDGRVVECRNPEALAGAILDIIEDREMRSEMARNARVRASEFTWEAFQNRLLEATFEQGDAEIIGLNSVSPKT